MKALFVRINLSLLKEFLEKNNFCYESWFNGTDEEIRVELSCLSEEQLIKLFKFVGLKYDKNIFDYDYIIFWY